MSDTNTFGKSVTGAATMGAKYKDLVNSNPGPGQYTSSNEPATGSVRISKAERKDIWDEQTKNGAPGPGNY